jgi:hypothetical protein
MTSEKEVAKWHQRPTMLNRRVAQRMRVKRKGGRVNLAVLFYILVFVTTSTLLIFQTFHLDPADNKLHTFSLANFTTSRKMKTKMIRRDLSPILNNAATVTKAQEKNTKPIFVMHVGVPKTATSTLQHVFETVSSDLLAKDNWHFAGKVLGKDVQDFPILNAFSSSCRDQVNKAMAIANVHQNNTSEKLPDCWKTMMSTLDDLYQRRVNVLVSEENLCIAQLSIKHLSWSALQRALSKWQVKIVVSYRRWPEWVASSKNQMEKPTKAQIRRRKWPKTEGGLPTRPIYPYFLDILSGKLPTEFPNAKIVVKEYQKYFQDISIVNFHAGDIVSNFMCQVLNATNTCVESQQQTYEYTNHSKVNKRVDMSYDMLAIAAAEAGLINLPLSRVGVTQAIREYHQQHLNSTPWILNCPDKDKLKPILRRSMQLEKEIVPEFYAASKEEHATSFWKLAEQDKFFCSVDTTAMLKNPKWRLFFQNLRKENIADQFS